MARDLGAAWESKKATGKINRNRTLSEIREDSSTMKGRKLDENFSLDDALREPGFADFLATYPGARNLEMSGTDPVIQKRYATFKQKEKIAEGIKSVHIEQISGETGFDMENLDWKKLDERLNKMAVRDPEAFEKLFKSRRRLEIASQELTSVNGKIDGLLDGINKEDLETKAKELTTAKKHTLIKRMFNGAARRERRSILEKYNIDSEDLREALKNTKGDISLLKRAETVQNAILGEISKARAEVFKNDVEPLREISRQVIKEVRKKLFALSKETNPDVEEVDKIAVVIKKLRESKGAIDYTDGNEAQIGALEANLNIEVERTLCSVSKNIYESSDKRELSSLEQAVENARDKMSREGLDSPENRARLVCMLDKWEKAEKDVARKLLLKRLIIKIKQ